MKKTYRKILVTGAHGFLGKHLIAELHKRGYKRIICPTHKEVDLTSYSQTKKLLKLSKPDSVIHCAAKVGGIAANRDHPGAFFYDNLVMGVNLIEESRRIGVKKFIAVGTICAYPEKTRVPFKEEDIWKGYPESTNAPYGLAKKMLLVQSQAYRQEYGFNSIFLLPVNLYGPGDNFNLRTSHVVPALIRKFDDAKREKKSEVVVWGDGRATREFLYAGDCARALCLAMEKYNGSEPVNIGTGKELSIKSLAEKIRKIVGYKGKIVWDKSKPNGQLRRCLDTKRAYKEFGFKAKVSFKEGLKKTIQWYRRELASQ